MTPSPRDTGSPTAGVPWVEGDHENRLEQAVGPENPASEPPARDFVQLNGERDRTRVAAIRYALGIGDSKRPFMRPRGAEG